MGIFLEYCSFGKWPFTVALTKEIIWKDHKSIFMV